MKLKILGSAAGGGVPQWNCNHIYSRLARQAGGRVVARTQSSLAASADGRRWALFNASPDIRQQIAATPELWPAPGEPPRSTPIGAVVLTNADVDHIAGLLSLREREPFHLYALKPVLDVLQANSVFGVLDPALVRRIELPVGRAVAIEAPTGPLGLEIEAYPVPGKIALFLEKGDAADFASDTGDTAGVCIRDGSVSVHYVPGCARVDDGLKRRLAGADCLFFDGTLYTDNEMAEAGVGAKTGRRMGHMAMSGPDGSVAALADVPLKRRIFVHINNTNPVLDPASAARRQVTAAGWEIGEDGMEIVP